MFGRGKGMQTAGLGFVGASSSHAAPPPPPAPTAGRGMASPFVSFRAASAGAAFPIFCYFS